MEQSSEKNQKRSGSYETELKSFQQAIEQERTQHPAIYSYLTSIHDLMNKTEYYPRKKSDKICVPFADELEGALQQALNDRISQNHKLEPFRDKYRSVLKEIFRDKRTRLNHPAFFLFLPYLIFFELGKCENLMIASSVNAFSVPQLDKETFNWSIRYSPIQARKEEYEHLDDLYDLVEDTVCRTLHNYGFRSIGSTFLSTICEYSKFYDIHAMEFADEIEFSPHYYFSTPLCDIDKWARCFCNVFNTNIEILRIDMHRLFSLTFRSLSGPAESAIKKILAKYAGYSKGLQSRSFYLSNLLKALCDIYNLQTFNEKAPFESKALQQSVSMLMDFLIALNVYPIEASENSTDENWMYLLSYSNNGKGVESWYEDMSRCLTCPSRVLYRALTMRALAKETKVPKIYGLSEYFPYSDSLKEFSESLYNALCSENELRRDMSYWGGVKVILDKEHMHNLNDAFRIWSVWHADASAPFEEFCHYIRKNPECLSEAALKFHPFNAKSLEIDLSTFDFDTGKSDMLSNKKQELFDSLPKLKKLFGSSRNQGDFQYAFILYFLLKALRERMCRQVFELCMKILQLT